MDRQRPHRCANDTVSIFVLVDRVLGIQQPLHRTNRQGKLDEIFRRGVVKLRSLDAIVDQPLMHEVQSIASGLDQLVYLVRRQVLTVAGVSRIRDC